jgi:hypothetical protein
LKLHLGVTRFKLIRSLGGSSMKPRNVCLLLSLLLAGSVTNSAAQLSAVELVQSRGLWQLRQVTDRISGKQATSANLTTFNVRQQSRKTGNGARLSIFCDSGKPVVFIAFVGLVSSRQTASFAYRIDSNPGQTLTVDASSDRKSLILKDGQHVAEFLRQIGPSSTLFVRVNSPRVGISEAEFSTAGAATAIDAALSECRQRGRTT